ncbi:hypothetical protein TR80_019155 [Xanthomonas campestris]|nr:hypothetical protein TR80_019155 [Xanthomonas campestris]
MLERQAPKIRLSAGIDCVAVHVTTPPQRNCNRSCRRSAFRKPAWLLLSLLQYFRAVTVAPYRRSMHCTPTGMRLAIAIELKEHRHEHEQSLGFGTSNCRQVPTLLSASVSASAFASACFCICLCSCSRGPIPQRQALRVKPHRGGAHGCATFFKGTGTSL